MSIIFLDRLTSITLILSSLNAFSSNSLIILRAKDSVVNWTSHLIEPSRSLCLVISSSPKLLILPN